MSIVSGVESWVAGEVKNVEQFLGNLESPVAAMAAQFGRDVVVEFRDALGFFETEVFNKVSALAAKELSAASSELAANPIAAVASVASAVLGQLPGIGIQVGAQAVLNIVAALAGKMAAAGAVSTAG
jgi:mannose/fructose/N-acetylgalactosamine-specific phosphotransferase system component IID